MVKEDYDKEWDIFYIYFGKTKTEYCMELFDGGMILDFDKDNKIVGFEIFDFMKHVKKHDKFMKMLEKEAGKKK